MLAQIRASSRLLPWFDLRQLRFHGDHRYVDVHGPALWSRDFQRDPYDSAADLLHCDADYFVPIRESVVVSHGLLL